MKKLLFSAAVAGLISSMGSAAIAQQAAPAGPTAHGANAARYHVAVVDISFIFKNYPGFTSQIDKLKGEMEAADGALRADRDRLVQMEEQRNALKPGSPEFKALDEKLAHQKAEFSIKQGTVRRDFLEKEAQVYFATYNTVSAAVKSFAAKNDIGMVLRFTGDDVTDKSAAVPPREDVMRLIMQPIIHQNRIDITPDVLAELGVNFRNLPPQPTGVPGTAAQPQQGGFQQFK